MQTPDKPSTIAEVIAAANEIILGKDTYMGIILEILTDELYFGILIHKLRIQQNHLNHLNHLYLLGRLSHLSHLHLSDHLSHLNLSVDGHILQ